VAGISLIVKSHFKDTKYPIVQYVGFRLFKWKLIWESEDTWDVYWTDRYVN